MHQQSKINVLLSILLVAPCNIVAAEPPDESGKSEPLELEVAFSGDSTPDGIIFRSIIRRIDVGFGRDPERTLRQVKAKMSIDDDKTATSFVKLLQRENKKLSRERLQAKHHYICSSRPSRTKIELFRDLDELTKVEITLAELAYDEFYQGLQLEYAVRFGDWIADQKDGFRYVVPSAEQVTKRMGVDAVAHYKNKCIDIEQRMTMDQ